MQFQEMLMRSFSNGVNIFKKWIGYSPKFNTKIGIYSKFCKLVFKDGFKLTLIKWTP